MKPVILTVDDELDVLNAVEKDLRRHYLSEYKIIKSTSGNEALTTIEELKRRNTPVALFLVDQRMPELTGIQFLEKASKIYPQARKILLTAYADTEVAIKGINDIGLDYYLMKPWDPPEEQLYPILDEVLYDWKSTVEIPYQGIRIVGTLWSSTTHTLKDFLARNQIPYQFLNLDTNGDAKTLASNVQLKKATLPFIFFPDGQVLSNPTLSELAEKIGLKTRATMPFYDLIIIGAGPTGLASAVYAASEGLKTLLLEKEAPGGQAGTSPHIDNYLGFPQGLSGATLTRRAVDQARRFGVEILLTREVVKIRVADPYRYVTLSDGNEIGSKTIIISSGVTTLKLDKPGIEKLTGAGIYYGAAATEAANYKNCQVFVIGGANSAGQGALLLAKHAKKVYVLIRRGSVEELMSQYLVNQIKSTNNITVLLNTEVVEVKGKKKLTSILLTNNKTGKTKQMPADAMFIFIGAIPHTEMVAGIVERNNAGFIVTGPDLIKDGKLTPSWTVKRQPFLLETSVPGIFAAGDVRNGTTRRVAAAIGEGATAVNLIHQYLKTV